MRKSELPIDEPCHEDWGAMRRDPGSRRFCDQCSKHVHDLTSMTEAEAREVLASAAGERICVRYRVDGSGNLKFRAPAHKTQPAPSLVPVRALRRPAGSRSTVRQVAPVAAAAPAALAVALAACTPHGEAEEPEAIEVIDVVPHDPGEHVLMGAPVPVEELGDETGEAVPDEPCDPSAAEPVEIELMGDIAVEPESESEPEPEPEPEAKAEPEPEPEPEPKPKRKWKSKAKRDVIMGRLPIRN